jgi:hypothetical protein
MGTVSSFAILLIIDCVTWRHISEVGRLYVYRFENRKSHIFIFNLTSNCLSRAVFILTCLVIGLPLGNFAMARTHRITSVIHGTQGCLKCPCYVADSVRSF